MEKVKVSEKLYREMKDVEQKYGTDELGKNKALRALVECRLSKMGDQLHRTTFLDFARILIFGYELDKKDLIKSRMERFKKSGDRSCEACVDTIYDILEAYEIELKGINKK